MIRHNDHWHLETLDELYGEETKYERWIEILIEKENLWEIKIPVDHFFGWTYAFLTFFSPW